MEGTRALVEDLIAAREELMDALARVDPRRLDAAGLVGDWGARELVAHLGYWAGHAVEAIHAVEDGRAAEFGVDRPPVEVVNATVARVARETDLATVRRREAASVEVLLERMRRLEPSLLAVTLPQHGLTLEAGLREDGADHYREHAEQLRAAVEGGRG